MKANKLNWIFQTRWLLVAIFLGLTLWLGPQALKLEPDNSVESLSVVGDPAIQLLHRLNDEFGGDEFISLSFKVPDLLSRSSLKNIEEMTQKLERLPHIREVISLTRLRLLRENGSGSIEAELMIRPEWIQSGVPQDQRQSILDQELYRGLVYNQTGTAASIVVGLESLGRDDNARDYIIGEVRKMTREYESEMGKFYLAGIPVLNRLVYGIIENEEIFTTGGMITLVCLMLWVMYRRFSLLVLPMVVILMVMSWLLGLIEVTGQKYTWVLAIAPGVVLIVCICDSIHIINGYLQSREPDRKQRILKVVYEVGLPCLLTSLTTAVGFLSLASSKIVPIRNFGLNVSFGVVSAFIASVTLLPLMLYWIKDPKQETSTQKYRAWIQRILNKIHYWNVYHTRRVFRISLVIILLAVAGIPQIINDQRFMSLYKWGADDLVDAVEFGLEQGVGGTSESFLFIESPQEQIFYEPSVLNAMDRIKHRSMEALPGLLVKIISLSDLVKMANQSFHHNDPAFYKIPDTKTEVAQLLFLYSLDSEQNDIDKLVNDNFTETRMRVFGQLNDSGRETFNAYSLMDEMAREELAAVGLPLKHSGTGTPLIGVHIIDYIMESQMVSLALAMVVILAALSFLFRSFKLGLISMIPNVVPLICNFGFMGWFGIELDIGTAMVACVAIGVAVDDTIHFIWNVKKRVARGLTHEQAIQQSFNEVGHALVNSSIILVLGFSALMFSQIWPTTYFGMLTALACITALLADLFLAPVLLLKLKPMRREVQSEQGELWDDLSDLSQVSKWAGN